MGIGGLDKEFSDIFRRAFASRVFPPDIVEQLGEILSFALYFPFISRLLPIKIMWITSDLSLSVIL